MKKFFILLLVFGITILISSNQALARPCQAINVPELLPPGAELLECDSQTIKTNTVSTWVLYQLNGNCFLGHELFFVASHPLGNRISISQAITPIACDTKFKK
jgi:hypothetical protein